MLDRDGSKALLLSEYGLDCQPYNTKYESVIWEKCTLRNWLNGTFYNKAFTSEEQKGIVTTNVSNVSSQGYSKWSTNGGNNTEDKVFLLSYAEANKYLGVTYNSESTKAQAKPTEYAIAQGAYTDNSYGVWWLRSPGLDQNYAAFVFTGGSLIFDYVDLDCRCVRPALWVNLESGIF